MMQLSEKLRKARIAKGLTQQEAADMIGVPRSSYADWEKGKEPRASMMGKISEVLGMTMTQSQNMLEEPSAAYSAPTAQQMIDMLRRDKEVLSEGIQLSLSALLKNDQRVEANLETILGRQDVILKMLQSGLDQVASLRSETSGRPLSELVEEVGRMLKANAQGVVGHKKSVPGK